MSAIQLVGGLDQSTSKIASNPGTLAECENFEVAISDGYRKIDGFARYDGREIPTSLSTYTFRKQFADGERGGGWGTTPDGGIPFYEGFGLNSGIWPPSSFTNFAVGDEVYFRLPKNADATTDGTGASTKFINIVSWRGPVKGYVIESPEFINVAGDGIDDVDLTVRTGQVFFPSVDSFIGPVNFPIIPNEPKERYGRTVIYKNEVQQAGSSEGSTLFTYGNFFTDMLVSGAHGTEGIFNAHMLPSSGLSWLAYNNAASLNQQAYRQTVQQFPGGYPLGMTWFRGENYGVARTYRYNMEDASYDSTIAALYVPNQWAYYSQDHQLVTTGPLGNRDPRSLIPPEDGVGVYQTCRIVDLGESIELLMPEPDPVATSLEQMPIGRDINLLTELKFINSEIFPSFGDTLDSSGGYECIVRAVIEVAGEEYLGICLVETVSGSVAQGDVLTDSSADNVFEVYSVFGGSAVDEPLCTIEARVSSDDAVIVKSGSGEGFIPTNMGYESEIETATTEPVSVLDQSDGAGNITDTGFRTLSNVYIGGSGNITWTQATVARLEVDGGTYAQINHGSGTSIPSGRPLILEGFGFELDDVDVLTGVEVEITAQARTDAATVPPSPSIDIYRVGLVDPDNPTDSGIDWITVNKEISTTKGTITVGSLSEMFGSKLTSSDASKINFGVAIQTRRRRSAISFSDWGRIFLVRVKAHYRQKSATVYFYDGVSADYGSAEVLDSYLKSGAWDGTGDGYLSFRSMTLTSPIPAGAEIRTGADGAGSLVANALFQPAPNRLPGPLKLAEESSQYQFITSNFFASENLEAVYGASGAGNAFTFNDSYFIWIRTGLDDDKAIPRHIGRLKDRLVLGYANGNIDMSVPAEPTDYSGSDALTLGVGDKIVGMLRAQGDALFVFTESQIIAYQGADNDTLQPSIISANSGAIEYTVQDMGIPVFCDFRGVSTISVTDKYGDFQRGRLSELVHPWLNPRLQGVNKGLDADQSVAGSIVVRNKSQYRVIFKDGYVLTMTFRRDTPEFTIQRYSVKKDGEYLDVDGDSLSPTPASWVYSEEPVLFSCASWGIDERGSDRIFLGAQNYPHMIELDRGNTFDGLPISSYLVTNPFNKGDTEMNARFNVMHIHSSIRGYAELSHQVGTDYSPPAGREESFALGDNTQDYYSGERPAFSKTRTNARGRDISIRLNHESTTDQPFTIQALGFADVSPRRKER